MCGIMFCHNFDVDLKVFEEQFNKIKDRGPDKTNIVVDQNGVWGFHRLAIMDLSNDGMQPFTYNNDRLICNGEIFNFRKIKKELQTDYVYHSESDCEVLLPLFEQVGFKMFEMLDGEFAMVFYSTKHQSIIAARDHLGIRPLFYGFEKSSKKICFASEVKALIHLCDDIKPFPIGSFYYNGKFYSFNQIDHVEKFNRDELESVYSKINYLLTNAVEKRLDSDAKVGFLLSGGLDSSLVCSIASRASEEKIRTFAIGMSDDAIDLKYAKIVADYLGTDHTEVIITKEDVIQSLRDVIYTLETWDITTIRASVGMYLLCKYIHQYTDIRVILTGEVSDELFGYKYTDFAPNEHAFQEESEKRVRELYMYDVLRADRCIAAHSLEARVPFSDRYFMKYVLSIQPKLKMNRYNMGKYLLRKAFEGDYLPSEILYRDKAAFSDAVGHSLVDYLKEHATETYTDLEFESLQTTYSYCKPFSKESLLYRQIFEEFYPNQAHLIQDYWMPNREWDGCNVNDPSARVLVNYGKSGE